MNSIRQTRTMKLKWFKPSVYRREYHLVSEEGGDDDDVLAIIRWDKIFSSLATAECPDGKWTFQRQGFLHPCVTIRLTERKDDSDESNNNNLAVLHISWDGSGVLEFQGSDRSGGKYRWKRVNYWNTEYTFGKMNEEDNKGHILLLHFKPEFKLAKLEGTVDVSQDALLVPEISVLMMLGWYLVVLVGDDRKQF